MVGLTTSPTNESYVEPSPYAWLRSRAPVPTSYAPACEPLYAFREVLENRTSRARGMAESHTEVIERKFAICIEICQVELEDGVWRVSFHKYAYVHGDPISNIDPTGWALVFGTPAFGYAVEDVVEKQYALDFAGNSVQYGRWARVPGAFRAKPDILDWTNHTFNEIKPLTQLPQQDF
jgi:hypothetical protein